MSKAEADLIIEELDTDIFDEKELSFIKTLRECQKDPTEKQSLWLLGLKKKSDRRFLGNFMSAKDARKLASKIGLVDLDDRSRAFVKNMRITETNISFSQGVWLKALAEGRQSRRHFSHVWPSSEGNEMDNLYGSDWG